MPRKLSSDIRTPFLSFSRPHSFVLTFSCFLSFVLSALFSYRMQDKMLSIFHRNFCGPEYSVLQREQQCNGRWKGNCLSDITSITRHMYKIGGWLAFIVCCRAIHIEVKLMYQFFILFSVCALENSR